MNPKQLYEYAAAEKAEGNDQKALEYLEDIINNHPESSEAELAMAMRYNINSKHGVATSNSSLVTASYVSAYGSARSIAQIISLVGWIVVAVGALAAILGILGGGRSGGLSLLAILPGIGIAVSGLFLVVAGQITRATVDNADHTREILSLLKEKS